MSIVIIKLSRAFFNKVNSSHTRRMNGENWGKYFVPCSQFAWRQRDLGSWWHQQHRSKSQEQVWVLPQLFSVQAIVSAYSRPHEMHDMHCWMRVKERERRAVDSGCTTYSSWSLFHVKERKWMRGSWARCSSGCRGEAYVAKRRRTTVVCGWNPSCLKHLESGRSCERQCNWS